MEGLTSFDDARALLEQDAVKSGEDLPDKDDVCEVLFLHVVEEVEELVVVACQKQENQLVFQLWGDVRIEVVLVLD